MAISCRRASKHAYGKIVNAVKCLCRSISRLVFEPARGCREKPEAARRSWHCGNQYRGRTDAPALLAKKIEAIKKMASSLGLTSSLTPEPMFIFRTWWLTKRKSKRLWTARRFIGRLELTDYSCLASRIPRTSPRSPKGRTCQSISWPRLSCRAPTASEAQCAATECWDGPRADRL